MSFQDGGYAFSRSQQSDGSGGILDHGDMGMTTRVWLAGKALANKEMEDAGGTMESAEKELGLEDATYNYKKHYPMLIAKRALSWADAIIAQDIADTKADYEARKKKTKQESAK
jgi:hypothetical protein